jgi:hypothetical protein
MVRLASLSRFTGQLEIAGALCNARPKRTLNGTQRRAAADPFPPVANSSFVAVKN